jgi:hypothetical protein
VRSLDAMTGERYRPREGPAALRPAPQGYSVSIVHPLPDRR